MKKQPAVILAALCCVLVLLCLWKISDLSRRVEQLQNDLNYQNDSLNSIAADVSNQVQTSLRTQQSILASSDQSYGPLDPETWTVPLTLTATPKEQTPGVTTAVLVCGGTQYPMTAKKDGSFSVQVPLPLFEETAVDRIIFTENGTQRTEGLDQFETPYMKCLSFPLASLNGSIEYSPRGDLRIAGTLTIDGLLSFDRINGEQSTPKNLTKSIALLDILDGKERSRTDYDLSTLEQISGYYIFNEPVTESYPIPDGSVHELVLEMTDSYGLRYRTVVNHQQTGTEEREVTAFPEPGYPFVQIYDPEGNLLFEGSQW